MKLWPDTESVTGLPAVAAICYLLASAACTGPNPSRDVDLVAHSVLTTGHRHDASLRVAFLPTPESCSPQDLIAARTLSRLDKEQENVAVLTLVPSGLPREVGMDGLPFPGHVVRLPIHVLQQAERKVARPRLEVYGRDGQLLLLRPVYPYEEEQLLYEELLGLIRHAGESG